MKKKIGIFISLILFLMSSLTMLTGCWRVGVFETEYFICKDTGKETVYILGLTDKGKEQEYLIIPEKINGKIVGIGMFGDRTIFKLTGGEDTSIQSDNLKKVFFMAEERPSVVWDAWPHQNWFAKLKNPLIEGVFAMGYDICDNYELANYTSENCVQCFSLEPHKVGSVYHEIAANVVYMYNYTGAKNKGYYFIDNYELETIKYIPEDPVREGYEFGGWYKESECIHQWDFERDIVPYTTNKNGETNRVLLYAKWIEM